MEDVKYIDGEMNLDVSSEVIAEGDYSYARNLILGMGQHGKAGSLEPMRGSSQLDISSVVDADDETIGMCTSQDETKLFLFMRNADPVKNKIVGYDLSNAGAWLVLASDVLDFGDNLLINNAKEINGYLYFIDSGREPKCVSTTYWPGKIPEITDIGLGKRPMPHAPEFEKFNDPAADGELLPDMLSGYDFQFATQYQYEDNKLSVISPMSVLATANMPDEYYRRIRVYLKISKNQVDPTVTDPVTGYVVSGYDDIDGTLPQLETIPQTVVKINIAVRIGNGGAWNIIDVIEKDSNGIFERNFTDFKNNTNGVVIPDRYYVPYDIVPQYPNTQELARNRMFYGNFLEGYDTPGVKLEASYTETDFSQGGGFVVITTQVYEQLTSFFVQAEDDTAGSCPGGYGDDFRYIGSMFRFVVSVESNTFGAGSMVKEYKYIDDASFRHSLGAAIGSVIYDVDIYGEPFIYLQGAENLEDLQAGDFIVIPVWDNALRYVSEENGCVLANGNDYVPFSAKVKSVDAANYILYIEPYGDYQVYDSQYTIAENVADCYWIRPQEILSQSVLELSTEPYKRLYQLCYNQCIEQYAYAWGNEYDAMYMSFATGGYLDTVDVSVLANKSDFDGLKAFSSNSSYRLGIVYKDGPVLRASGVATGEKAVVDIIGDKYIFNAKINWNIPVSEDAKIPEWAEYYSIVRTVNLKKDTFIEYNTADIYYQPVKNDGTPGDPIYTYSEDNMRTVIDISTLLSAGKGYTFIPGDRIILFDVQYKDSATGDPVSSDVTIDLPIISQEDGTKLILSNVDLLKGLSEELYKNQAIKYEIYSPRKDTFDSLFYEVGKTYNIDRSSGSPVHSVRSGVLEGDSINVLRNKYIIDPATGDVVIDPDSPQELYRSISAQDDNPLAQWNTNIGHSFVIDEIGQVNKSRYFRWTNTLLQDTKVNGLNEFDALNEDSVPTENGDITSLRLTSKVQETGTTMLAIGTLSPSSIYLGEVQWTDTEGRQTSALTRDVVGTIRPQANEYGCRNEESVIAIRGKVYWYDADSKNFCEYAANGTRPISVFRVGSYFDKIIDSETNKVVSFFDPYYGILFVNARETSEPTSRQTIGYDTVQEKWRSFYDIRPLYGTTAMDIMYLAITNELWKFGGHDLDMNKFFGTEYPFELAVSFNKGAVVPKEWDSIALDISEDLIDFNDLPPEINDTDFRIDFSNRNGQVSNLVREDFDVDNFIVYSDILNDENSDGGIMEGTKMASNTLQAKLTIGRNNPFQVFFMRVGYSVYKGAKIT